MGMTYLSELVQPQQKSLVSSCWPPALPSSMTIPKHSTIDPRAMRTMEPSEVYEMGSMDIVN